MEYKLSRLSNELQVLVASLPNIESVTVTVWTGVGSRFEDDRIAGISHFLEHMVFKGSKKRPSAKEIALAVDSIGGEFNAATSKEWTNFYIKARSENLETAFDVLSDMVLNPLLPEKEIEREKGVILEEMAMYEDTPIFMIETLFERLIYKGNSLARDIIGLKDSIKSIKRDDFIRYRKLYYGSKNMLITVSGGVDGESVFNLAEKFFGKLARKKKAKPKKFRSNQKKPRVCLHTKKTEQAHLVLGFLSGEMGNKNRFAEAVLSTILGQGMSSRLFTEVREKRGLAYTIKTNVDRYTDTGSLATYAGVDIKKSDEAVRIILDQYYGLASGKYPLSKEEIRKAKEYVKGHLALSLEDTKNINSFFGIKQLLLGRAETPEDVFDGIDKVTMTDLVSLAKKYFVPERLNLAIIGPYKDEKRFEKAVTSG